MSLTGAQWSQLRLQLDRVSTYFDMFHIYQSNVHNEWESQTLWDFHWPQSHFYLQRMDDALSTVRTLLTKPYDEIKSVMVLEKLDEAFTAYEELDSYLRGLMIDNHSMREKGVFGMQVKNVHGMVEEWYDIMVQGVDNLPIPTPGS